MAEIIDNIVLSLVSLKKELEDYFKDLKWDVNIFLASDPQLSNLEIVANATQRNQIELPVVTIRTGLVRNDIEELGDDDGMDYITLSLYIMALNDVQVLTLGNNLRRKLDNFKFSIKDYSSNFRTVVGSGDIERVTYTDISDLNSNEISRRHNAVLNATLRMNAGSFL